MNELAFPTHTSFDGHRRIASGLLQANALAVKHALDQGAAGPVLVFDNSTGRTIDFDLRGSDEDILARLPCPVAAPSTASAPEAQGPRGPGRPKLGVVPREVTLLPRHWDWLATQPGGASVALRKLVEDARHAHGDRDQTRQAQERAYHFMSAIAGDLPGFEEATRALFANDRPRFDALIAAWPEDVGDHAMRLAFGAPVLASIPNA